jgi:hypothetical protein
MTKRRFPDSPAIYKYLGGNEITAAARVAMAIVARAFSSLRFWVSAISTPVEQERRKVYHAQVRQGVTGESDPDKILIVLFRGVEPCKVKKWTAMMKGKASAMSEGGSSSLGYSGEAMTCR